MVVQVVVIDADIMVCGLKKEMCRKTELLFGRGLHSMAEKPEESETGIEGKTKQEDTSGGIPVCSGYFYLSLF